MGLALPKSMLRHWDRSPAPIEFSDAVELYARRFGRHGRLHFVPVLNCWIVELKVGEFWVIGEESDDQSEASAHALEPTEVFYLTRPSTPAERASTGAPTMGYKLDELGVQGMIDYLERTNTLTGRGEFTSNYDAAIQQLEQQRVGVGKVVQGHKDNAVYSQQQKRKQVEGVQQKGWTRELEIATPEFASKESK